MSDGAVRRARRAGRVRFSLSQRWQVDRETLRLRLGRLWQATPLIVQSSVAAGLAWLTINQIPVSGRSVVFAPIVAVIIVAVAQTQRLARAVEVIGGVALGLLFGDALVAFVGTGSWQVSVVVALAMAAALMVGGSPVLMIQAAAAAIIIAAIHPPRADDFFYAVRAADAVAGGAVGLLVSVVLLPVNPLMIARRSIPRVLTELTEALEDLAQALHDHDYHALVAAAERTREFQAPMQTYNQAMEVATETARTAPLRRRSNEFLQPYIQVGIQLNHVLGNLRVLTRRSRMLLSQDEPIPRGISDALKTLAAGVRQLLDDLLRGHDPQQARVTILRACRMTADVPQGIPISAQVIVGQVRSTAVDLLQACGLTYNDADRTVRAMVTRPRLRRGPALLPTLQQRVGHRWGGATGRVGRRRARWRCAGCARADAGETGRGGLRRSNPAGRAQRLPGPHRPGRVCPPQPGAASNSMGTLAR